MNENNKLKHVSLPTASVDVKSQKSYKYVCITTNKPDTKSNPSLNPNPLINSTQYRIKYSFIVRPKVGTESWPT